MKIVTPHTGHKTFDKELAGNGGLICKGNVHSDNMYGFHVRARRETECNGYLFPYGHLQEVDLKLATTSMSYRDVFPRIAKYIDKSAYFEQGSGWCYIIRHMVRCSSSEHYKPIVHGILLTTMEGELLRRFDRTELFGGFSGKSAAILDYAESLLVTPGKASYCSLTRNASSRPTILRFGGLFRVDSPSSSYTLRGQHILRNYREKHSA